MCVYVVVCVSNGVLFNGSRAEDDDEGKRFPFRFIGTRIRKEILHSSLIIILQLFV